MRLLALCVLSSLACEPPASDAATSGAPAVEQARSEQVAPSLDRYDLSVRAWVAELPGRLDEISGLAFTADGRLFAHDDERGRIHEIDPRMGEVGKRFDLGGQVVNGDFEGIATTGERFFVITSVGFLYEFREGEDREALGYRVTDTGVGASCEVEGLDHDPVDDALLVACKVASDDAANIVVHRIPIDPEHDPLPPLRVPKSSLVAHGLDAEFDPSAIVVTASGTYLLLSSRHSALIEVDRSGRVLVGAALTAEWHAQPEGLEIADDGTLYISDERNGGVARLTAFLPTGSEGSP